MISIDQKNMKINFSSRSGFGNVPGLAKDLLFAHVCPSCNNVMQAFFKTDQEVKLWPYEETHQMSIDRDGIKAPEFRHSVPTPKDPQDKSQYNVYYDQKNGAQKIVLKNHVLKYSTIDLKNIGENADWEPGGKMCELAGLFSLREDLLLRDYVLFSRINERKLWSYDAKNVSDVRFQAKKRVCGFPVEAIGDAPPVILIRYNILNRGWENAVEDFLGHLAIQPTS